MTGETEGRYQVGGSSASGANPGETEARGPQGAEPEKSSGLKEAKGKRKAEDQGGMEEQAGGDKRKRDEAEGEGNVKRRMEKEEVKDA